MKAILVIDIPDDLKYEEIYFDGEIRYTNEFDTGYVFLQEIYRCLLKPMPEELPTPYMMRQIMIADGIQTEKPPYTEDYQKGYNDCISEILGEEDDR